MATLLEGLKRHRIVVADAGDIEAIGRLRPRAATANPSLILEAADKRACQPLLRSATAAAAGETAAARRYQVLVAFGLEILRRIDGRVSTDVPAPLSPDNAATHHEARRPKAMSRACLMAPIASRRSVSASRGFAGAWTLH